MPKKQPGIISLGIWLVLLFALTTMFGAGSVLYYFSKDFEHDIWVRYNEKQYEHVQGIARELKEVLSLIQKDLEFTASLPDVQGDNASAAWPQLEAFYRRFGDHINDIARIDANGNFVTTYRTEMRKAGQSALNRPSTRQTIVTHNPSIGGPYTTYDNTKAISIDVPVFRQEKDKEPVFVGTVSCRIDIDKWIKNYVTPYDMQLDSFTWIVSQEHKIVAHSNAILIGQAWNDVAWNDVAHASFLDPNPPATNRQPDREFLMAAFSGAGGKKRVTLGSLGGEEQLVAYAPLHIADANWLVISNASYRAVLQPFFLNMQRVWIVGSGFVGLFFIVVIFSLGSERKKLQTERELRLSLQQSEKKYRMLIERSNDAILLTSPDGFVKLVNKRFTELMGRDEESLLGHNFREMISPACVELLERESHRREEGFSASYELDLLAKKRQPITVICSESPVFNRNSEHIGNLSVLTDITEKKKAEQDIKRQNEEMFTLNVIAETANQSLILEEIFEATTRKLSETLKLDCCLITAINEKTRDMTIRSSVGCSPTFLAAPGIERIKLGEGYAGRAAELGELIVVADLSRDEDPSIGPRPALKAIQEEQLMSTVFVPIKARQACYGIIACGNRSMRTFSDQDLRLLKTIGQTVGLAVEKAQLYQNARRRAMRLESIYRVSDRLTALLTQDELLPAVVRLIHEAFNYYNVNILLYDKPSHQLVFIAGCGGFQRPEPFGARITPPEGVVGWCFQKGEPVLVDDVSKETKFIYIDSLPETRSELAVPILTRGEAIGVLDVQSSNVNVFDQEDILTLQALAELIGVAAENAQLYQRVKHSLDEVRKSQAFFAKIVLESPLATVISEPEGTCILLNESALLLLGEGMVNEEVIGKYNILKDAPFAGTKLAEQMKVTLSGEVVQFTFEIPNPAAINNQHPRHEMLTLRATLFPLMDDAHKVANVVAQFEDLSEKKMLEEALTHAQKMESIGTLAGGIAHDFNNILGGVLGYTSFIKTKMGKTDPFYRYINIIDSSARRATELTQQLLAFARGGKYRVQVLDLNQLVKEAIELIESTIDRKIAITLKLANNLPAVEGDGGQMIQTIVNMCINARDAMEEGGQLILSTRDAEIDEPFAYRHPGSRVGRYVLLTVSDTGAGMSEETRQRIFEPFFTTKKDKKGTGLGLAMVYGIVKNHGGYIDVTSELGHGTTFSIYLPRSDKKLPANERKATIPLKKGHETILVAEDEDIMRDLLIEMLDTGGYQVISVETGKAAIDTYQQRQAEIDLVIINMGMPELDGRAIFRKLKEINPDVKVLVASGFNQDSQTQEILSEGVLGFIQKPYGVSDLLDKIRLVMDAHTPSL